MVMGGMVFHGWGHVYLLGFVVAIHLEGFKLGVEGGFPLPPSLHTFDADPFRVAADEDVPVQHDGLVASECVGQLLHM